MFGKHEMTFHANYRDNVIFWILSLIGVFGIFIFGLQHFDIKGVIISSNFLIMPLLVRLRYKVIVTDDALSSITFFGTKHILWSEIISVSRLSETNYLGGRFYEPSTYIFTGDKSAVTVNFKLFSHSCSHEVFSRVRHKET